MKMGTYRKMVKSVLSAKKEWIFHKKFHKK